MFAFSTPVLLGILLSVTLLTNGLFFMMLTKPLFFLIEGEKYFSFSNFNYLINFWSSEFRVDQFIITSGV